MAGGIDWFRWHHGSVTDPKFQLVARKAGARLGDVIAVWAFVLEAASAHVERGQIGPVDVEAVDCMLGCEDGTTLRILTAMEGRGLIEGQGIAAWEKRQPKREDDSAAERKRRQREREHELAMAAGVTSGVSRDVTHGHDREEKSREEINTKQPTVAPALPLEGRPALALVDGQPKPYSPPDCPHVEVLALWAEVLPAMPQHLPSQWKGTRAGHLRARWRETAVEKRWASEAEGLAYMRRLFGFVGQSRFLTGRVPSKGDRPPFVVELAWLVCPDNWAKTIEGKFHQDAA
tara:strand:- start:3633 stop:4502 length:870 start_codon:yes stop_codon:yes gene_type:complete